MENQTQNEIKDLKKLLPSNIISEVKEEFSQEPKENEFKLSEVSRKVSNFV